jgi:hypothetical protein
MQDIKNNAGRGDRMYIGLMRKCAIILTHQVDPLREAAKSARRTFSAGRPFGDGTRTHVFYDDEDDVVQNALIRWSAA